MCSNSYQQLFGRRLSAEVSLREVRDGKRKERIFLRCGRALWGFPLAVTLDLLKCAELDSSLH